MRISLTNCGKRFNRDWIFRQFSYDFYAGHHYAITGPNGSGKSTLLQVIGGAIVASEGKIRYHVVNTGNTKAITGNTKTSIGNTKSIVDDTKTLVGDSDGSEILIDDAFRHIAIAAPYLEVIEEMTLNEFLRFHQQFKPFITAITTTEAIAQAGLTADADKQIRYYSSGMKQRVKLIQAIFSDASCLLLDEPCTNLDVEGIAFYQRLIADYAGNRTVIVSSNDVQEYGFCEHILRITDYK
jgi:ABC-type multidrug transport system ATPase subunit